MADDLLAALAQQRAMSAPDPAAVNMAMIRRLVQGGRETIGRMAEPPSPAIAAMLLGAAPGAGDAMAARDSQAAGQQMVDRFRAGDYGGAVGAGLESLGHGLGALPMIPAFGGMMRKARPKPLSFDDLEKLASESGDVFVRYTDDIARDMKTGSSMNFQTGRREAGLSALDLRPGTAREDALAYSHMRSMGGKEGVVVRGNVKGRGGDDEPVIEVTEVLGVVAPKAVDLHEAGKGLREYRKLLATPKPASAQQEAALASQNQAFAGLFSRVGIRDPVRAAKKQIKADIEALGQKLTSGDWATRQLAERDRATLLKELAKIEGSG